MDSRTRIGPFFIELPILVAIRVKPISGIIPPSVSKAHGNPICRQGVN
jgi:hypothetical protein